MKKNPAALEYYSIIESGVAIYCEVDDTWFFGKPLQYYLSRPSVNLDTVKMLVEAYSGAVTSNDSLLVHCFLCNPNISGLYDILDYIIQTDPSALHVTDEDDKRIPLHFACSHNKIDQQTIRLLLDNWMESTRQQDSSGNYLIHTLCHNRELDGTVAMEILSMLIEASPDTVQLRDVDGDLPIHVAARNRKCPAFCKILIDANPESVRTESSNGASLPIHDVTYGNGRIDTAKYLLELHPDGLNARNSRGFLPIHFAAIHDGDCEGDEKAEIIKLFLSQDPSCASRATTSCLSLPLHLACGCVRVDLNAVQLLLDAYPQAVNMRDSNGFLPIHKAADSRGSQMAIFIKLLLAEDSSCASTAITLSRKLPLHLACGSNRSFNAVQLLLDAYPQAAGMRDIEDFLPIHISANSGGDEMAEIIKLLLAQDSSCASKAITSSRKLPLHLACGVYNRGFNAMQLLFDAYPEGIFTQDSNGKTQLQTSRGTGGRDQTKVFNFLETQLAHAQRARNMSAMTTLDSSNGWLPLHHALNENASLGAIKLLVKGFPSALRVYDHQGMIPLHIACMSGKAVGIVQFIVELDGTCLDHCDFKKHTALHHACREGNCDVVKYLLNRRATSVSDRNIDDKLPIHLLCESEPEKADRNSPEYIETVWLLLVAHPETVLNW